MIDNILFKYMDRLQVNPEKEPEKPLGPVITISRDYGCYAGEIAEKLALRITEHNQKHHKEKWIWICKEIITEAAKQLQNNTQQVRHIIDGKESKFLADIVFSFSKSYNSDDFIKKTITEVVRAYAEAGNVVILGRAGCIIAKNIPDSLHIKIIGPMEWRIASIAERHHISMSEAKKIVLENDKKRANFIKLFKGDLPSCEIFDAIFNRGKLSADEIVDQILLLAKVKKLY